MVGKGDLRVERKKEGEVMGSNPPTNILTKE